MNIRKIINIVLIILLISGLFILTGCGEKEGQEGKETKVPNGKKLSFSSTSSEGTYDFYYPEDAGIEVEDTSETYKILKDTEENYRIEINLRENTTYKRNKEENKDYYSDTYKEFKIGGYDAYSYGGGRLLNIFVLLDEYDDWYTTFEIDIDPVSQAGNEDKGSKFFENNEEVKSIINSLTFNAAASEE